MIKYAQYVFGANMYSYNFFKLCSKYFFALTSIVQKNDGIYILRKYISVVLYLKTYKTVSF